MTPRTVLSVASECVPLVKTGGLADVVGALPGALAAHGWQMRVLMPLYRSIKSVRPARVGALWQSQDLFGGPAHVFLHRHEGAELLLLDAPHLYDREGGPYSGPGGDHSDNAERFAALSWVAAQIAAEGLVDGWRPEVLHAHDWQGGLAPAYLRYGGHTGVKTVLTIHNIAFQGVVSAARLGALRLPFAAFTPEGIEYWGNISTLKAGLVTADAITTVSPRYAEELMRGQFGMGLEGVIASRAADVTGILNGTDTAVWNPQTDPRITAYGAGDMRGKAANREALIREFGLQDIAGPLAVLVSRLTWQKGIDLVAEAAPEFLRAGGGLIVLGAGETGLEEAMQRLATAFPGRVGVKIGYDEDLSHRIFAGGDAVLVPSRFEPCGLTQMYGLRYGAVPVVSATGGLVDTVIHASPAAVAAGAATGIVFHPTDGLALSQGLRQLVRAHASPAVWAMLQANAMRSEVGWAASSAAYAALYERLTA